MTTASSQINALSANGQDARGVFHSRPDREFLGAHLREGSRRAAFSRGSPIAFEAHLTEVEDAILQPPTPGERIALSRETAHAQAEIEMVDWREADHREELGDTETSIADLLKNRANGTIRRESLLTARRLFAALLAALSCFGLVFFYASGLYSVVYDPTLLVGFATGNLGELREHLALFVAGVIPEAFRTGGIGLIAFLSSIAIAVQVAGFQFAYRRMRWMVVLVILLDVGLAGGAVGRLFALGVLEANTITIVTFAVIGLLIVLTAFLVYTSGGLLLRFAFDESPTDSAWHYSGRQLVDLDARRRTLLGRIEADKVRRSASLLTVAANEARLDGRRINWEVTEAVCASILTGWIQGIQSFLPPSEVSARERDFETRYRSFLDSVRVKYGTSQNQAR